MRHGIIRASLLPLLVLLSSLAWGVIALPVDQWIGESGEIAGVEGTHKYTIGYPEKQRCKLTFTSAQPVPAGVYWLRLQVRASHVSDEVAWKCALEMRVGGKAELLPDPLAPAPTESRYEASIFRKPYFRGLEFARANQPEWKTIRLVMPETAPLELTLVSEVKPDAAEKAMVKASAGDAPDEPGADLVGPIGLAPTVQQYFALEAAELAPISRSGYVAGVTTDKIRYTPGETLRGTAVVKDAAGKGGAGTLTLYLEHDVNTREKVKTLPVTLTREAQTVQFDFPLPTRELGYTLVAEYTSADGADTSEDVEHFTIAANFLRVAIHGSMIGWGSTSDSPEKQRQLMADCRKKYQNCGEMFAWAEEDMVGLSPESEWWFAGQSTYHLNKTGLKSLISEAHKQGISAITYGKFIMSGYLGWKTAYDYPLDHQGQYRFPVGMWESVMTKDMDRFYNKEFVPFNLWPNISGSALPSLYWQDFIPITPDPTPRMTRIAAEAILRSIEMFGWDGVRWDGHPRAWGGQCAGQGNYDYYASRQTQALVRYFKDIVNAKYPNFQHGYNYLYIQKEPNWNWAYEDFELDELCRGGGLLMNESIRGSGGQPFEWIGRNIQIEGDLCRERGGFFLGISCDGSSERDKLVEAILYAAGGCRVYNHVCDIGIVNRYVTRYMRYTFDETLRRLEKPEGVLKPVEETKLWWQPYVYETAREGNAGQLVVNLLNIPRTDSPTREYSKVYRWNMPAGTDPATFALTLPAGYTATGAHFIDPFTLAVTPVAVKDGRIEVPPVDMWLVLVVDMRIAADAPTLNSLYGPPRTFGVKRASLDIPRLEPKVLDISKESVDVNKDMLFLSPQPAGPKTDAVDPDTLTGEARTAALLKLRDGFPEKFFLDGWWKGGTLPDDLKLKDKTPAFGDLTPRRDGRMDIYYVRGGLDYRLRLWETFAALPRFRVHDAPLQGAIRTYMSYSMVHPVAWKDYPQFDLMLFTSVPHAALGAENWYAVTEYVKAGGAAFFTGGEYAFGKGGYHHTVLDRTLLPVTSVENLDAKYVDPPAVLEPGKDLAELGIKLDFAAKPAFYCYNRVVLKPGVKVFLKSGERPILVGWQVGKGRVACLLLDHRGKSEPGVNMFFDWKDWPALVRAVMAWLAPTAGVNPPAVPAPATEIQAQLAALNKDAARDIGIDDPLEKEDPEAGLGGDGLPGVELDEESLKTRITLLTSLLRGEGKEISLAFAGQLGKVVNLPPDLHERLLEFVRRTPPPGLAEIGKTAVASRTPALRETGFQLLAIAGDPAFVTLARTPPPSGELTTMYRDRNLACAIACYQQPDLLPLAKERVKALNDKDLKVKMEYTGGQEFSLAAPEQPCLNSEEMYQRVAWLAYLSGADPANYGVQFAREWLLIAQYMGYAEQASDIVATDRIKSQKQKETDYAKFNRYLEALRRLDRVATPAFERLYAAHPELVAQGFAKANFLREVDRAIAFFGNRPVKADKAVLTVLAGAKQERLAGFAKARLASQ
ncbi:MAG: glutamine amidotransferase [Armatimonadota bacterium]